MGLEETGGSIGIWETTCRIFLTVRFIMADLFMQAAMAN